MREEQTARHQLEDALAIVRGGAADENISALDELHSALNAGRILPDTDLTVASWVAVQKDLLSGLRDRPALRAALVSFFERIERLHDLHRLLVDQKVGAPAAMTGAEEIAARISGEMKGRCISLLPEGRHLATELTYEL
jgi:hypothetical protein